MTEIDRGLDRLYKRWQFCAGQARRFESRPLDDEVRQKWFAAAAAARGALEDEERRLLLDRDARLHA